MEPSIKYDDLQIIRDMLHGRFSSRECKTLRTRSDSLTSVLTASFSLTTMVASSIVRTMKLLEVNSIGEPKHVSPLQRLIARS